MVKTYLITLLLVFIQVNSYEQTQKFDNLFQWMRDNGAEFENIEMRQATANLRGVFAKRDIKKGETVLFVPENLTITLDVINQSEIGIQMSKNNLTEKLKYVMLASMGAFYLTEYKKGEDSFFFNYFDTLPGTEEFPYNYKEDEYFLLKGSPFIEMLNVTQGQQKHDYNAIKEAIPEFGNNFTFDDYNHATHLATSRNFGARKYNGTKIVKNQMLVPMADMLNTEWVENTVWFYSDSRKGFVMEALKEVAKDEQLLDSYGNDKTNGDYLMNYAFILLDDKNHNAQDEYPIFATLNHNYPLIEEKVEFLKRNNSKFKEMRQFKLSFDLDSSSDFKDLLSWVRFAMYNEEVGELQHLFDRISLKLNASQEDTPIVTNLEFLLDPISIEEELVVWYHIRSIAIAHLEDYHSSLEEDLQDLENDRLGVYTMTQNERNINILLAQEKKILMNLLYVSSQVQKMAQLSKKQAKKYLFGNHKSFKGAMKYIQDDFMPMLRAETDKKEENLQESESISSGKQKEEL